MGEPEKDLTEAITSMYEAVLTYFRIQLTDHHRQRAPDLAQETILAALQSAARSSGKAIRDPVHYILAIARNKLQDVLREKYQEHEREKLLAQDALAQRVAQIAAEAAVMERERKARIGTALRKLSPEEARVIELRYGEGLSNGEASRRLGIPPDETSRIKYRALEKLKSFVKD